MITIPEIVESLIKESPVIGDVLSEGLINHSALARKLKPEIEKKLYKEVQLGAIIMALNRLSEKLKHSTVQKINILKKIGDITVRSNLIELTFVNSPTLIEKQKELLHQIEDQRGAFFTFSQGVFETTIFASQSLETYIKKIYADEQLKKEFKELSSITLLLPQETVYEPGVYYSILKILAWEGINFVEVISSYTELTIFLDKDNVDKAFSALKSLS